MIKEQVEKFIAGLVGQLATGMPAPVNVVTESSEFKNSCVVLGRALQQYGEGQCSGAQAMEGGALGLFIILEQLGKSELKELILKSIPGITGQVAAGVIETVL